MPSSDLSGWSVLLAYYTPTATLSRYPGEQQRPVNVHSPFLTDPGSARSRLCAMILIATDYQ
jgi:hypothetical protein